MRMKIAGRESWVCVISAGRPSNVVPLQALLGCRPTWVVPEGMRAVYRGAGAIVAHGGSDTNVAAARNAALEHAFELGLPCVMLDDDLSKLRFVGGPDEQPRPVDFLNALSHIVGYLAESTYRLGGANSTDNAYFVRKRFATKLFIPTAFMAVEPNDLRFDERLPMREDYDYCCQHIDRYGGALRCNQVLPTFAYKTNAGGMQGHRTEEANERSIQLLEEKWPGWIHRNTKRQGEILLRIPHRQREVLS